jgi:hypothetical protein
METQHTHKRHSEEQKSKKESERNRQLEITKRERHPEMKTQGILE